MNHLAYLQYVLRHKWFVFVECCKLGIPWLGIIHDWSKFLPSEWFGYVHFFHNPDGTNKQRRDSTGYYKPNDTGNAAFDWAWFWHQKHNRHHWQSWVFPLSIEADNPPLRVKAIPDRYRREMLADWRGAGRAQGRPDVRAWWIANKGKMLLDFETVVWIEQQLGLRDLP